MKEVVIVNAITKQQKANAKGYGWNNEQIEKGYDVFQCEGSVSVIDGALVIELINDVGKFDNDFEACRQAEKDGIKFINDVDELEKGCYIDTLENRKHCIEMLKRFPEYRVPNLIKATPNWVYWEEYKKLFEP